MNKIIIVDDHALFREGIKLLIENEGLGEVVAEAENGQVLLDLLGTLQPDLVIMDIEMPVMGGLEATRKALMIRPGLKILVLTMLNDKANYFEMTNAGATGFVLKTAGKQEFEKAIKTIIKGESYFSNDVLRQIILNINTVGEHTLNNAGLHREKLSAREIEVLQYFCEGLTVSEIASKLFISIKTVESHRSALLKKTNTKNTINLVLYAIKNNLVSL
ncbi:MAG: response regulator transcription factor [Paludibacter sp.]|nr:response regulator transcription factor [Paludibacter sp.]MDD4197999.1 response regulator transcription factor [Paludibacter sp.]MDD4427632.1 response regulator transcription factor [Paludibacter sp.]